MSSSRDLTFDALVSHMASHQLGGLGMMIYSNMNNHDRCDHVDLHWGPYGLRSAIPPEFLTSFAESEDGKRFQKAAWEFVSGLVDAATDVQEATEPARKRLALARAMKYVDKIGIERESPLVAPFQPRCRRYPFRRVKIRVKSLKSFHSAVSTWKDALQYAARPSEENLTALVVGVIDRAILRAFA